MPIDIGPIHLGGDGGGGSDKLTPEQLQAILAGKTTSKAGVKTVKAADGSQWLVQVDEKGAPVTGADGQVQMQQITGPGGNPVKLSAGQTAVDGQGKPIAAGAPKMVKDNRGNIYSQDPSTGDLTLSQAAAPSTTSVASGSSIARTDPTTGQTTFTQAPLSPLDQYKQQVDYWDAKLKQGTATQDQAKAAMGDWINRNVDQPIKIQRAAEQSATAAETGDISALSANRSLLKDKYENALANSVVNLQPGWWKTYGQPGGAQPDVTPVNAYAKALQALDGISPYATALNRAKAQLNLPDNTQTGTPPPPVAAPVPVPAPPAPLTDQQRAALANIPYTPPSNYEGPH